MKRTAQLAKCIVAIFIASAILNIFYILKVLPQWASQVGFVIVILGVILVNIKGMNKKDRYKEYKNSYTYKTINHNNSEFPGRGRGVKGSFGERSEFSYMYYIYVHRNDYEHAYELIQGN